MLRKTVFRTFVFAVALAGSIALQAAKEDLVQVQGINPAIQTKIVYATDKNFTGQVIYPEPGCYLLKHVAQALSKVQQELEQQGLGLKIWDAFRPLSAQWKLWHVCSDPKFVSDPREGGRHTRGTAVDLTLIRLEDGAELAMPTEFDDFTEKAFRDHTGGLSEEQIKNRKLLEDVMHKHGFIGLPTEWWHFDFQGWEEQESLDIDFSELETG